MSMPRPLIKEIQKKMFLKVLHEHKRPGGFYERQSWDYTGLLREKIEMWREEYNEFRPHRSLGGLTPQQFAEQFRSIQGQKTIFLTGPVFG